MLGDEKHHLGDLGVLADLARLVAAEMTMILRHLMIHDHHDFLDLRSRQQLQAQDQALQEQDAQMRHGGQVSGVVRPLVLQQGTWQGGQVVRNSLPHRQLGRDLGICLVAEAVEDTLRQPDLHNPQGQRALQAQAFRVRGMKALDLVGRVGGDCTPPWVHPLTTGPQQDIIIKSANGKTACQSVRIRVAT
jgi:hypothetical protein